MNRRSVLDVAVGGRSNMRVSLYDSAGKHMGGAAETGESVVVMTILKKFSLKRSGPCPLVWLFFDAQTGLGEAVATGWFTLKSGTQQILWEQGVGVQLVPTSLHQTLMDCGPEGLRWSDGKLIVNGS